ncbi:MAG TPA: bifunctional homocysteine S-methyltransferase/methylenetetrahydrofolate reductase [Rectinemataceae bacterium]|nr:bifunctional homocysteine S-methyltransferase/methylenetetrahydrofolate reductase [Rectinemataceae bacterium]
MRGFRERLAGEIIVFDGGMGTYLYEKGTFINSCFEELNLSNPSLVAGIHAEYRDAGADVIETNTFGANRFKLAAFGLEDRVESINCEGARLAREAAGDGILVAGSVGPLDLPLEPLGRLSFEDARGAFAEQIRGLVKGGVDLIIVETFAHVPEIVQALRAARAVAGDLPVIAQVSVGEDGRLLGGASLESFVEAIAGESPDVVGFNCSVGPKSMLEAVERLRSLSRLPLSAQPNAGLPATVGGRKIYMSSPEYLAEYAKRFIHSGAAIVGGCCGTRPEHIRAIRRAVRALNPVKRYDELRIGSGADAPSSVQPVALAAKSALGAKLARGDFVRIVELVSPKGQSAEAQIGKGRILKALGIDAINIPDGPRASARMSALALAAIMQREVGVETVLHYACRDRNVIGMQADLLGAAALGIRNVLAITGDPPKLGAYPDASAVFDIDSIGLVHLLARLNRGLDLAGNPIGLPTAMCVGVGVNPGAMDLDEELRRLELKIAGGAEFMITQPVFDLRVFETFKRRIEDLRIPLICGIWPLVSLRNAEFMNNEVPGAHVADEIMERMRNAPTGEEGFEVGIAVARETLAALEGEVDGVQLAAPLGRVEGIGRILGD